MEKITVTNLNKSYGGIVAVNDVSFEVQDREFFSILGPSGCGKSTTLRCVAGLESPSGGQITIGSTVVNAVALQIEVPTEDRPIGMVFQNYAVWPHMTVRQNVAYPLKIARQSKRTIQQKLAFALEAVGLETLADRYPNQLSGGEQQRVALARALIKEPEVLLLDEPLSNLDAKLREQMRFELKELQRRTSVSILYVTHDQAEALAMSDRLAVMSGGRIMQIGTPAEVYSRPANEFVANFIGSMNFLQGSVVSRNSEIAMVEIGGGATIPVCDSSPVSERVLLAIRPEDIRFTDAGEIPCRIEISHYLGSVIDYRVRVGANSLRVQTAKTEVFREGEDCNLTIDRAMIFPLR